MVHTRSHRPRRECQLLLLPAELRNEIYRYAVVLKTDARIQLRNIQPPPLLSACQQIRHEAAPIFFSENRFALTVAIPPAIRDARDTAPRIHRVRIPNWIRDVEARAPLHMRDVKVEIDYAFRWVVVTMGQNGGRVTVVEAWLHNGRQQLPVVGMGEKIKKFVDWTMDQKTDVDEEVAGLNYRDAVLIAGKMCQQWAGSIVPV